MVWLILVFLILVFVLVRRIPVLRVLVALVALGVALSSIQIVDGPPPGFERQNQQRRNLSRILSAMWMYMGDHDGVFPDQFSQLFPTYLTSDKVGLFFDEHASDFKSRCKKATADLTEVDRSGMFDCVAGKIQGLLAVSKTPFVGKRMVNGIVADQPIRVILEINEQVSTESEEDFQRRLKGEFSQIEKVRMGLDALVYGGGPSFSRRSPEYAAMQDAQMAKALQLYVECCQIKEPKTEEDILHFISVLKKHRVKRESNGDLVRLIEENVQDEKMRANVMRYLGIAEKSISGSAGGSPTENCP